MLYSEMLAMPVFKKYLYGLTLLSFLCLAHMVEIKESEFDHFVFSQQWPVTVCLDANLTRKHRCSIPSNVTAWNVHGLWPTNGTSEGPEFCNKSLKFNETLIKGILDQLRAEWANLFDDTPKDDFWKHEWEKHGTCGLSLPSLDNELKYFKMGLSLHDKYNILKLMKKSGIVPKKRYTYEFGEFMNALKSHFKDPVVSCLYDKESMTQYIGQIEICLNKSFSMISCNKVRRGRYNKTKRFNSNLSIRYKTSNVYSFSQREPSYSVSSYETCRPTEPIAYPTIH